VGNPNGGAPRPVCQICDKVGHSAIWCYQRYNHAYNDDEHSANHAATSYNVDPAWYMDTGATDHITSDLDRLAIRNAYNGNDRVHIGNGAGLHISHVGHSTLNTTTKPLALRNILHVPHITKNLLSAHKLTKDNNVFVEIHPYHFVVKELESRRRVLEFCVDNF
jgi:histone deacetylase 1/2